VDDKLISVDGSVVTDLPLLDAMAESERAQAAGDRRQIRMHREDPVSGTLAVPLATFWSR